MKHQNNASLLIILWFGSILSSHSFSIGPSRALTPSKIPKCTDVATSSRVSSTLNYSPNEDPDNRDVNVNIVDDVDPVSLTAIGFALIAFNFFVFANMGDSGIGGIVARIINTFN